jgi:hypothetical protein
MIAAAKRVKVACAACQAAACPVRGFPARENGHSFAPATAGPNSGSYPSDTSNVSISTPGWLSWGMSVMSMSRHRLPGSWARAMMAAMGARGAMHCWAGAARPG